MFLLSTEEAIISIAFGGPTWFGAGPSYKTQFLLLSATLKAEPTASEAAAEATVQRSRVVAKATLLTEPAFF